MTITAFLEERISEDESTARDMRHLASRGEPLLQLLGGGWGIRRLTDPEHILAECAAKRAIIEQVTTSVPGWEPPEGWDGGAIDDHEPILRMLASVYAEHPDYQQEWASV